MKQTLIYLSVIVLATVLAFGLIHTRNVHQASLVPQCPTDVMMCPDGSSVPRSGPSCEFGVCKQETKSNEETHSPASETITATSTPSAITPDISLPKQTTPKKVVTTNLFTKITSSATSLFNQAVGALGQDVSSGIKETQKTSSPSSPSIPPTEQKPSPSINEMRYTIKNNKIIDQNNNVVYVVPQQPSNSSGSGPVMETHLVNAVQINEVAPIIGAIPVEGLPGKYYLSENSFGDIEKCEFSNKIYILDTKTNTRTLMYEENSATLGGDDPRACNSEMFLLATESEKLVLKYHTINTNMICDSTWSEPEKTWYLDVTHLEKGTRRYVISSALSTQAEASEALCRSALEGTTTPQ